MQREIFKMFNGNHIDLSKILMISPAYFEDHMGHGGYFVSFDIHFQLLDKPLKFSRSLLNDEYERIESYGRSNHFVKLIDGAVVEPNYYTNGQQMLCVSRMQKHVDEIVLALDFYIRDKKLEETIVRENKHLYV